MILNDSDHTAGARLKRYGWLWKAFCRGHNMLYMDRWSMEHGDSQRQQVRKSIGYVQRYASRMTLATAVPRGELGSTNYCLATAGREYLVYLPEGGAISVDLSGTSGAFQVEWFNPRTGTSESGGRFRAPRRGR
ncbi:MAG: hypothetical protein HYS04_20720 [Acidobacteria bacterium]|nr:hypothetical protein [Acidobacteriota bacterium]